MEKSSLFDEVESLCGATGYPLRSPRLEDTVLDAHTREPITVITERYLGVLRFCRWSQPGHNQKLAHLISEIRVERSHLMFCTNCHKIDITTGYCSWVEIHVCVCFLPIHSGHQVRWTYQPGSHRISHPPSFCGACLNFSCEKDSAIPFPRRL